jgi:hypothetical protein
MSCATTDVPNGDTQGQFAPVIETYTRTQLYTTASAPITTITRRLFTEPCPLP